MDAAPLDPRICPPSLVDYLDREIGIDADRLGPFFDDFADGQYRSAFPRLPPIFLLELCAVLRMQDWEQQAILIHLEAGLPDSSLALRALAFELNLSVNEGRPMRTGLSPRVYGLLIEKFSWVGPNALNGSVRIDVENLDALITGLANFLWKNRQLANRLDVKDRT